MFASEEWKPAQGFEGLYEVSSVGRVRNVRTTHILCGCFSSKGYRRVCLQKDGKKKIVPVHRLVAMAFIPNPANMPMVNHKDENKANNDVSNLEWCDNQYNVNYGTAIERAIKKRIVSVIATDNNGNETCYASIKEAAQKMGVSTTCISQCCRRLRGRVNVKGFSWRYADEEKHKHYVELRKNTAKKKATPVIAISKDGRSIYFMSIKLAVEATGADGPSIIRSCREGKYRSGGYMWHYATKQDIQNYSQIN